MKKSELIAALCWVASCLSREDGKEQELFDALRTRKVFKIMVASHKKAQLNTDLMDTYFPTEE